MVLGVEELVARVELVGCEQLGGGVESREADVAIAVSNSLGFGGHNAALVLKRYG